MSGRSARLVSGPYQLVFVGKYLEAAAVKITCAQKNYHQSENRRPSPSSALMMKFDWVQLRALQLWPDRPGCVIIWGVSLPVSQINSIKLKRKKWRDEGVCIMSGYKKHLCIELCFDHISISIAIACPQDPQCVTSTSFGFQYCSWKKKNI